MVVLMATLLLPLHAAAQLSSATNSTSGATCSGANNGDGFCGNSVGFSTANNGTTFTSRYAWNINADVGIPRRIASEWPTIGTRFVRTAPREVSSLV